MEKRFIQPHEVTKEMLENNTASQFIYNRIKDIAAKRKLIFDGDDLEVGNEVFFGTKDKDGKPTVVSALCKGYVLTTDFNRYDEETGKVNCWCEPIYLGKDGQTYKWSDDFITSAFNNRKDAEDALEEMIE